MPAPHATAGDEYRAELVGAGLSKTAVQGILNISGESYVAFSKNDEKPNFGEAIMAVDKFYLDLEKFIKTQSKEDQVAYDTYQKNQKAKKEKLFY